MGNDKQAIILPSKAANPALEVGGKNSKDAEGIRLETETDIIK